MMDCLGWTKVILQTEAEYLQMKWPNKGRGGKRKKKKRKKYYAK